MSKINDAAPKCPRFSQRVLMSGCVREQSAVLRDSENNTDQPGASRSSSRPANLKLHK
jgi:hypothetical protein